MTILKVAIVATALLAIGACTKGANEKAGEAADKAVENTTGTDYNGDGPRENVGEVVDEMNKKAADEAADSMENQADAVRGSAEKNADAIEDKAESVRDSAEKKADAIEEKADDVRK
jgi:hypothetical protein